MIKVYLIKEDKEKYSHIPFLYPNLGYINKESLLFMNEASKAIEQVFDIKETPAEADFLLLPYNYFYFKKNNDYINKAISLSKKYNKKILVFDLSDFDYDINIPNSIILRTSQYKYKKKENEFIIPPLVEDLGANKDLVFRSKSDSLVVGFTGWADFLNLKQRIKHEVKNLIWDIKSLWNSHSKVHKQGIYFRRQAIKILKKSDLIKTDFILRKSYSSHSDTIELDPKKAREEYIQNILDSDFVLCPKGDGNYSARFYEVLSLGRIPVLIDTETILPNEEKIAYGDFILRIDYKDIYKMDRIIYSFYSNINEESFIEMQRKAREAFKKHLDINFLIKEIVKNYN
ncbi:exostosin family protein [candidate division KSB1 bacterium]